MHEMSSAADGRTWADSLRHRLRASATDTRRSSAPIVAVCLGDDELLLDANDRQAQPPVPTSSALALPLGARRTAADYLAAPAGRSAAYRMEAAIQIVEDELTRAAPLFAALPRPLIVASGDAWLASIARAAGVSAQAGAACTVLTRAAVEATFARLAALVLGQPAVSAGLPDDTAFAGALLVLREAMHHLDWTEILLPG